MSCDQCDDNDVVMRYRNGYAGKVDFLCANCGNVVSTDTECDRFDCYHLGAQIYKATLRLPRRGEEGYRNVKCRVRRCDPCAAQLPPRWRKVEVSSTP